MLTRPKLTPSRTNWPMVLANSASRRVCKCYKDTGPLSRDLHISRGEWASFPKRCPRRPSGGAQRRLGRWPHSQGSSGSPPWKHFWQQHKRQVCLCSASPPTSASYGPEPNAESNGASDRGALAVSDWAKTAASASGRALKVNPPDEQSPVVLTLRGRCPVPPRRSQVLCRQRRNEVF